MSDWVPAFGSAEYERVYGKGPRWWASELREERKVVRSIPAGLCPATGLERAGLLLVATDVAALRNKDFRIMDDEWMRLVYVRQVLLSQEDEQLVATVTPLPGVSFTSCYRRRVDADWVRQNCFVLAN